MPTHSPIRHILAIVPSALLLSLPLAAIAQSRATPPSFTTRKPDAPIRETTTPQHITLTIPKGTPIRVALSKPVRVAKEGAPVTGRVIDTVYSFDQPVIAAGSEVRGKVIQIAPISKMRRAMAAANADFSPPHEYTVAFDTLVLTNGRVVPVQATVAPGTEQVIHLASAPPKANKKNATGDWSARQKQAILDHVQSAKAQIKSPGRIDRAKQFLLAQLPYRRQYLLAGTRFDADLSAPLDFGTTMRSPDQLSALGNDITPDSILRARLVREISSATARNGTPIEAIVTEPLFDASHHLVIAVDSRLTGKVTRARPATKLHHNGELRIAFDKVSTPEGFAQNVQGNLSGVTVDRSTNVKIDEEGGTRVTDNKSRYLLTALSLAIAATAVHGDPDGGTSASGGGINPGQATAAGAVGFKLVGAIVSATARSRAFSAVLGGYGAATSVYSHFLSSGKNVVLPKDTSIEVAIGDRHPDSPVPTIK